MVVLGQDRLDVRREWCEVALVEDRLDELSPAGDQMMTIRRRGGRMNAHISLQILVPRVWLNADEIAEHAGHGVVAEDDDLLPEELETAWVAS